MDFKELIRVSEAKAAAGLLVHTIANTTANAAGIRQVVFRIGCHADEQRAGSAGTSSSRWREHKSGPGTRRGPGEGRPAPAEQWGGGGGCIPGDAGMEEPGGFWAWLKGRDNFIERDSLPSDSGTADSSVKRPASVGARASGGLFREVTRTSRGMRFKFLHDLAPAWRWRRLVREVRLLRQSCRSASLRRAASTTAAYKGEIAGIAARSRVQAVMRRWKPRALHGELPQRSDASPPCR